MLASEPGVTVRREGDLLDTLESMRPAALHLESAAVEVRVLSSLSGKQLLQDIQLHVEGSIPVIRSLLLIDRPQETVTFFRGADLLNDDSTLIGGIEVLNALFAMEQWQNTWRRFV